LKVTNREELSINFSEVYEGNMKYRGYFIFYYKRADKQRERERERERERN